METFANMISTFASISPSILTGPPNAVVGLGGRLEHPTGSGGSFQMLTKISVKQEAGFIIFLIFPAGHCATQDLQLPPEVRCWPGGGGLGSSPLRWGIYPGVQ